ncbi:MORN repeat-containing protein [Maribacter sp. 2210JD10-5]|uniref:MORN repeat-containing protein n=1 Tax=Maribacter sp. 2210JD10-5 TaxID=3386272 RepID=UPI0039BD7DC8
MKKRIAIPYLLFGSISILAIYLVIQSSSLEHKLRESEKEQLNMEQLLMENERLLSIDSVLLNGNYSEAIASYKATLGTERELNNTIPLRIALAERLMKVKTSTNNKAMDSIAMDSLRLASFSTNAEIRKYDSLTFALEKAKVELRAMRNQLQNKSLGKYLQFESKKGNQMHYVGQVKNNKAHGTGIAILDTGSRYEGQWKENERHGEGTFYWPDGEYYVGSYDSDKRNGLGTYYWPNGEKYTGQWKDDKRNGKGSFYGKDGEVVTTGIWKDDKLTKEEKK